MARRASQPRELTRLIEQIAHLPYTVDDDGTVVTHAEALARLVWLHALGGKRREMVEDRDGNVTVREKAYQPRTWAIELVFNRMEGRVPDPVPLESSRHTVAERVSELARERLNKLAEAAPSLPDEEAE